MLYAKTSQNTWTTAKKVYVKTAQNTWSLAKKIYVKAATGTWRIFWPSSSPQPTTDPYFSTDSAGNTSYANPYVRIGSSLYGNNGAWDNTGFTAVSYAYQVQTYPLLNSGTATVISSGTYTIPVSISISTSGYSGTSSWAGQYLDFKITDNNSQSEPSTDFASNTGGRIWVITNPPSNNSNSIQTAINFPAGSTITYTSSWNGSEAYCPDASRISVIWYKSTTKYTTLSDIQTYATQISSSLTSTTYSSTSTTFLVTSTYTTNTTTDPNNYFYAVETEQNSGSDYSLSGGTKVFASSPELLYPPTVSTYPTLTSYHPSGTSYVYDSTKTNASSALLPGDTVYITNGAWTPQPTSLTSYVAFNLANTGLVSSWNVLYTSSSPSSEIVYTDTNELSTHSFVLPSIIYNASKNAYSSAGYYLGYGVDAYNGSAYSEADAISKFISAIPNPQTIISMTFNSNNSANVTWSSLYTSSYYQLTYSTSSSTSSGTWTPIGSTQTTTGTAITYNNLPSGTYNYSVISYNSAGVGVYGPVFSYNSTPPPSNVSFYTYGYANGYGNTTQGSIYVSGDSTTTSISYTIYRATNGSITSSGNANTYVQYDSGTFTSLSGYAGGTYSVPENGYYYMVATPTNSNGTGNTTYSNISGQTGTTPNWIYCGTPEDPTSANNTYASGTSIVMNWVLPSGINTSNGASIHNNVHGSSASYEIWWQANSTPTPSSSYSADFTGISATSTSYVDNSIGTGGVTRYYFIRSRNANSSGTTNVGNWVALGGATTPLQNQTTPTLGSYTSTVGGFTIPITNYDSGASYVATIASYNSSTTPTASVSGSTVTVSNMSSGSYSYVYVTASKSGYNNASSSQVFGYATSVLTPPTITAVSGVAGNISVSFSGGSGPYYQVFWYTTSNYNDTVYDANGTSSPITVTDLVYPGSSTWYFYVRYVSSLTNTGTGPSTTISNWSSSVSWIAPLYTVTWNANGGSVSPLSSSAYSGSSVTAPTPTLSGYSFNGWYNAASGGLLIVSGGGSYTPTSSTTLYAQWTYIPPTYSVFWYEQNPSTEVTTTQSYGGQSLTGPTVSYSGYTFNGWYTASSGGSVVSYSNPYTFAPSSSESLYAQWIQAAPGTPSVSYSSSTTSSIRITVTESGTGSYGNVYYSTSYWSSNSAIQSYASYAGQITGNGGFTVSGLASSTTYYIYVIPYNSSGVAGNFGYTTGTTSTAVVAYPPYALSSVSAFSSGSPLSFSASWTAPSTDSTHGAATGYHFYVQAGNSSAGPFSNVSTTISSPYPSIANTSNTSISGTVTTSGSWSWIRVYVEPYNAYGSAPNYVGGVG